ncbi:voltage-dependent calcium channel beta subunit-associated regulatory protein-like [Anguilla rostrata]|uniref:voltage-dependent calcium channel beta subunit-associated regulatory protein-like n=1 Tax=Anguilla rostrata TaxID=7938 RepID=UPI0030D2825D
MSNESPVLKNLTKNATDVPRGPGGSQGDAYVTLLVLLCVFAALTLVLLSVLLVFCRHCYQGNRRYSRASNDPEKTNTTYLEESQPVPEITIQVEEADRLSAGSDRGAETERFLSTGSTGRRVSFNESALLDHGRRAQERGRRYTLTEGDFHHLKNARLTHLHLPPPAVRVLTIQEYNAAVGSAPKLSLSIFQPSACSSLPQTALAGLSPSSALPGDTLNSVVNPPTLGPPRSCTIEVMGHRTWNGGTSGLGGDGTSEAGLTAPNSQGSVLQFFTKLRRHSSLEGPSPCFKIKKWKFDSSQRASSLDTRGSPKRQQFQRQRAASESTHQQEGEEPEQVELSITSPCDEAYCPSLPSLPPTSPPPPSSRLEPEAAVESSSVDGAGAPSPPLPKPQEEDEEEELGAGLGAVFRQDSAEHQALYRDIWTLRASLERYASSDQSSNNDRDSVRSDADSVCSLGGGASRAGLSSCPSQDIGDEGEPEDEGAELERGGDGDSGNRKLLQMDSGYASIEAPLRAPEELRLFGTRGGGAGGGARGKTASEKRHFFTSRGRKGSVCEGPEARLFQEDLEDQAAVAGAREGEEEEEKEEDEDRSAAGWTPYGQAFPAAAAAIAAAAAAKEARPRPQTRRDYSIDEKTDALFNEFLRHDPRFDQQESPARPRHRASRVHLRKQWQRAKQHSDPGVGVAFAQRGPPMRRGDSANFPLDTRYHGTLPRIVSAADEEASEAEAQRAEPVGGGARAEPAGGGARAEPAEGGARAKSARGGAIAGGARAESAEASGAMLGSDSSKDEARVGTIESGAIGGGAKVKESDMPAVESCQDSTADAIRAESREGGAGAVDTPPAEAHRAEAEEDRSKVSPSGSSSSSSSSNRTVKEGDSASPPPAEPPPAPRTGHGPQTATDELADKLARGLEDRLYTGLRRPAGGAERVVKFTHTSPDHSPV